MSGNELESPSFTLAVMLDALAEHGTGELAGVEEEVAPRLGREWKPLRLPRAAQARVPSGAQWSVQSATVATTEGQPQEGLGLQRRWPRPRTRRGRFDGALA